MIRRAWPSNSVPCLPPGCNPCFVVSFSPAAQLANRSGPAALTRQSAIVSSDPSITCMHTVALLAAAAAASSVSAQQPSNTSGATVNATSAPAVAPSSTNATSSPGATNMTHGNIQLPAAPPPMYDTVFTAAITMNETQRIREAFTAIGSRGLSPDLVAVYQSNLGIIQDGDATITAFFPNELAWRREALFVCMTSEEQLTYLQTHPEFGADSWLIFLFNTSSPLLSRDFKDGLVVPGIKPGFNVTLRSRNNTTAWYLPGVSPNGSNVNIVATNIMAGRGVVHLTDSMVTDPALQAQHAALRRKHEANCSKFGNITDLDVADAGSAVEAHALPGVAAAAGPAAEGGGGPGGGADASPAVSSAVGLSELLPVFGVSGVCCWLMLLGGAAAVASAAHALLM